MPDSHAEPVAAPGGGHGHGDEHEHDDIPYGEQKMGYLISTRVGWLQVFFAGLLLTTIIMAGFEKTLAKNPQLSFFVPLIVGHAGNTGSQAVSTIIRALAVDEVQLKDVVKVLVKEGVVGAAIGVVLGVGVYYGCFAIKSIGERIAFSVAISLPVVSVIANVSGGLLPMACVKIGLDPAVIAAPLMTTVVDCAGIAGYLLIAQIILSGSAEVVANEDERTREDLEKVEASKHHHDHDEYHHLHPCANGTIIPGEHVESMVALRVFAGALTLLGIAILVYGYVQTKKEKLEDITQESINAPVSPGASSTADNDAVSTSATARRRRHARGRGSFSLDPREVKKFSRRVREEREEHALRELEAAERAAAEEAGKAAMLKQRLSSASRRMSRRMSRSALNLIMTEEALEKTTSSRQRDDEEKARQLTPRDGSPAWDGSSSPRGRSRSSSAGDSVQNGSVSASSPPDSPRYDSYEEEQAVLAIRIAQRQVESGSHAGVSSSFVDGEAAKIALRSGGAMMMGDDASEEVSNTSTNMRCQGGRGRRGSIGFTGTSGLGLSPRSHSPHASPATIVDGVSPESLREDNGEPLHLELGNTSPRDIMVITEGEEEEEEEEEEEAVAGEDTRGHEGQPQQHGTAGSAMATKASPSTQASSEPTKPSTISGNDSSQLGSFNNPIHSGTSVSPAAAATGATDERTAGLTALGGFVEDDDV